jgi:hypothetical protein
MTDEYRNWIRESSWDESHAREEGYRATYRGLSRRDNPFNRNDAEWVLHCAWEEGRCAGAADD